MYNILYQMEWTFTYTALLALSISCGIARGQEKVNRPYDPYFVESIDMISQYAPDHITRELLQDKQGNFWFATWMGIVKYDGKVFINYTLKDNLVRYHVSCCYEDKTGNLWFGTARGGIYRYNGKTFRLFTSADGLLDDTVVRARSLVFRHRGIRRHVGFYPGQHSNRRGGALELE